MCGAQKPHKDAEVEGQVVQRTANQMTAPEAACKNAMDHHAANLLLEWQGGSGRSVELPRRYRMNVPAPLREGKGEAACHSTGCRFIRREIAIEYEQSCHSFPTCRSCSTQGHTGYLPRRARLAPPSGQSERFGWGSATWPKWVVGVVNRS